MIKGKNIVITGSNSGIGLETLKLLAKGDNKILAVDLRTDRIEALGLKNVIPMVCDVSTKENVDSIFKTADEKLGSIDIFFANAGFPYYETMDYVNWERIEDIFKVNVFSPIYTYQKYAEYLGGKQGQMAITVSAIGKLAMPGYTLYSASKFAMQGFQQGLRYELPKNVALTCLYPIATDTGFFKKAVEGQEGKVIRERPFPVQKPQHVAKCMVRGLEHKRKFVNPSKLFTFAQFLFAICPPIKWVYLKLEKTSWIGLRLKSRKITQLTQKQKSRLRYEVGTFLSVFAPYEIVNADFKWSAIIMSWAMLGSL